MKEVIYNTINPISPIDYELFELSLLFGLMCYTKCRPDALKITHPFDIGHFDTIMFTVLISYPERIIQYLGGIGRKGQRCLSIDFIDSSVSMQRSSFYKRIKGYKKWDMYYLPYIH